ncbi:hypothetical protein L1987_27141 [Smallanthus sonchifolius]|uniref:Uncharacterized protein n=1 Tax=Smallanthus sonchifolius TaxID=185202 RepID=A0ACB9IAU0_9ASTR|nr:hypothetical protein L1987_27141 [Smallanthus sonchifolius]
MLSLDSVLLLLEVCGMKNSNHLFIGLKMSNARTCNGMHGRANTSGIKHGTNGSVLEPWKASWALHVREMGCTVVHPRACSLFRLLAACCSPWLTSWGVKARE